jgi:hypothetical protein
MTDMGHCSFADAMEMFKHRPPLNCDLTATDLRNASAVWGPVTTSSLKGKTHKMKSAQAGVVLVPRVTQEAQWMEVDIFFIKKIPFLLGLMLPLGLSMCAYLKTRKVEAVSAGIKHFLGLARSRGYEVTELRCDGENSVASMTGALGNEGINFEPAGPGQHVPHVENKIKTIKERVRAHDNSLPFVMTKILLIMCVLFCVSRINWMPSKSQVDKKPPMEQFSGRQFDAKRDMKCPFGSYVQATVPMTDNTMSPRTEGCITGQPSGNLLGSVRMWTLKTQRLVTRDQFTVLPMPDLVIDFINAIAEKQGIVRGADLAVEPGDPALLSNGHRMLDIDRPNARNIPDDLDIDLDPHVGVDEMLLDDDRGGERSSPSQRGIRVGPQRRGPVATRRRPS